MGNSDANVPKWIEELEEKVREIYAELIATNIKRSKHHQEAADALNKAVDATQRLTLNFLEQLKNPNAPKDLDKDFPYT